MSDLLGEVVLAPSAAPSRDDYYSSLRLLSPILRSPAWTGACNGYYLNSVGGGQLRLAYFTEDAQEPSVLDAVRSETGLGDVKPSVAPRVVDFSVNYDGPDADFRRWLCMYPQVGLDLLEDDWLHTRRLVATYRFEVSWAGLPARPHFETWFLRASDSYRSWSAEERDFFWASFDYWAGPRYTDWGHFFVNMVLAVDFRHPYGPPYPAPPSRFEINGLLARDGLAFDIPTGWTPLESS